MFGEVGVPEAALKEKKWTRIVVTVGPATVTAHAQQRVQQPQRARNRRQFHFGGVSGDLADDGNGLDEEDEEEYYQERCATKFVCIASIHPSICTPFLCFTFSSVLFVCVLVSGLTLPQPASES